MSYDIILARILRREGGYVDHPADKGGPTNYGITQATLSAHRGVAVTADDIKNMTEREARDIYINKYIRPMQTYSDDTATLDLLVDSAVHHGVARVHGWLEGLASRDPAVIYRTALRERIRLFGRIIKKNPSQAVFAEGWMNRVSEFIR